MILAIIKQMLHVTSRCPPHAFYPYNHDQVPVTKFNKIVRTRTRADASNDNTRRSQLVNSKGSKVVKKYAVTDVLLIYVVVFRGLVNAYIHEEFDARGTYVGQQ